MLYSKLGIEKFRFIWIPYMKIRKSTLFRLHSKIQHIFSYSGLFSLYFHDQKHFWRSLGVRDMTEQDIVAWMKCYIECNVVWPKFSNKNLCGQEITRRKEMSVWSCSCRNPFSLHSCLGWHANLQMEWVFVRINAPARHFVYHNSFQGFGRKCTQVM